MRDTAQVLHISPRTVETHINNIKQKLGADKRADIIKIAIDNGLFDIEI